MSAHLPHREPHPRATDMLPRGPGDRRWPPASSHRVTLRVLHQSSSQAGGSPPTDVEDLIHCTQRDCLEIDRFTTPRARPGGEPQIAGCVPAVRPARADAQ